jgi:hypothetical protein
LRLANGIKIAPPNSKWKWEEGKTNGGQAFNAANPEDHDSGAMIAIIDSKSTGPLNDAQKTALVKAFYDKLVSDAKRDGGDFQGAPPAIATPVPSRVLFSGKIKAPDGSGGVAHFAIIFGDTATYTAIGGGHNDAEAETLLKTFADVK